MNNKNYIEKLKCPKCGEMFYTRFMNYNEYMTCLSDVHHEIAIRNRTHDKLKYKPRIIGAPKLDT